MTTPKVVWATLTSGRKKYLIESRDSWYRLLKGDISEEIIIDTSGDPEYSKWLKETYSNARVFSLHQDIVIRDNWNHGIRQAYEYFYYILQKIECDYILHTEDDYVLLKELLVKDAVGILNLDQDIVQVSFIRQPWTIEEIADGGVLKNIRKNGVTLQEKNNESVSWTEHRGYFTFGPSIYRHDLCFLNMNSDPNPELAFTYGLFSDLNKKAATFGIIEDTHFVEHIGVEKG